MVSAAFSKTLDARGGDMELNVSFTIQKGAFVALYGRSGVGKTSVLRIIAGLMKPDQGSLVVDGERWYDSAGGICLKPQYRKVGFVFQDYALFPNMTVKENLCYALDRGQSSAAIAPLIDMMELGELRHAKPHTLSGGQQQRVALARALVSRPKLLLMDEPLSALDWEIRHKLQDYIRRVHQEYQLTSIMVSHDLTEVLKLSAYVYVLDEGKVVREGAPASVLVKDHDSGSPFGKPGEVVAIDTERVTLVLDNGVWTLPTDQVDATNLRAGDRIWLTPRGDKVTIRLMT